MDKTELKRTLVEQFVPLEQAVYKKLQYLQSDDVFAIADEPEEQSASIDADALENAFNMTMQTTDVPVYHEPTMEEVFQMKQAPQPQSVSENSAQENIAVNKQNIAAKIAALRGISMPGDYLRKK